MTMYGTAVAALGVSLLAGTAVCAGQDDVAGALGRSRLLVVIAQEPSDPRLAEQRRLFAALRSGARERDLVLVEGIGTTARAQVLRRRFHLDTAMFRAVLVGKDGGEKLSSDEPLGADRLFPLIDAMPMRQDEMRRRR